MPEEIKKEEKAEIIKDGNLKEEPIKNGEEKGRDPKTGRFIEGYEGGPGRTQGLRDWATDFNEAIKIVSKNLGKTESEIRTDLLIVGVGQARGGNFNFWNFIMERDYGKVSQPIEGGLIITGAKELADKLQAILDDDKPKPEKSNKGVGKDILQKPEGGAV